MEYDKYRIVQDEQFQTMSRVVLAGKGGSIPTVLTGLYTTKVEAIQAIEKYKSSHKTKVKQNASKLSDG